MLVLSRKRNERIMIGDSIIVTVVDFYQNSVRIGISAPAEVPVHRQEIAERIIADRLERERSERDGLDVRSE